MATIRARIETGFEAFGRTIFRNRLKTLALVSVLIAGFLSQLPSITFDASTDPVQHGIGTFDRLTVTILMGANALFNPTLSA